MSILNVNKINPVGSGSTITIAGIASVTNNISVGNSVTANAFYGDGQNITGTTIRPNFTFDGTDVQVPDKILLNTAGSSIKSNQLRFQSGAAYIDNYSNGGDINFRTSVSSALDTTGPIIKSTGNIAFASGKGIDFSAASGSNAGSSSAVLDDYEEGSWTATLNGHSSPTNVATNNPTTSRTAAGHYRRIGSYVHAQATWSGLHQGQSNDMHNHQLQTITGLPFTSMGTLFTSELGYSRGIYGRYNNSIIEESIFYFYLSGSSTTVYPAASQVVQNSPGTLYHTVSNSSSSMYYSFQMSYYTT